MKSHIGFLKVESLAFVRRPSFTMLLSAAWQRVGRWRALYRQRQQLAAMSDEMLKDIGLSRADIACEASRPFWDDPLHRG